MGCEKGKQIPKVPRWSIEDLQTAVATSRSIREVCGKLGLKATGGNYTTIKRIAADNNINLSIMPGSHWLLGKHNPIPYAIAKPLEEILVKGSRFRTSRLKQRLVKEGVLEDQCAKCGLKPVWNGEPLSLQLDHINGDTEDNRLDNLRILCPNCHSQTETFSGKKKILRGTPIR